MKWGVPVLLVVSGCATVSPERGHDEVNRLLVDRAGVSTGWEQGPPEDPQIAERLDALLKAGLTRRSAVAIALLNNPTLQATYEELGVSQADMVQAGLLKNPTLSGSIGFPLGGGRFEAEFSLVQEIVDLITLSWRKDVAERQFKASTLRAAQEALNLVSQVNQAFVLVQADLENQKLIEQVVQSAKSAHLLAEKQFAAGNINELLVSNERASYAQLQLELTHAQLRLAADREHLNRLLGLWGHRSGWQMAEALLDVPQEEVLPENPESFAVRQRLDLAASRLQAEVFAQALGLARGTRLFGRVEVGGHYHQDPNGPQLAGPTLVLELPIFDQRQAYLAKLEAEYRAASRRVSALAVDARSKVREGLIALQATRVVALYHRETLVPLRAKVVEQSQLHYNGMLLGLYQLLSTQQQLLEGQRAEVAARRDYWAARFDLENALGGSLAEKRATK